MQSNFISWELGSFYLDERRDEWVCLFFFCLFTNKQSNTMQMLFER